MIDLYTGPGSPWAEQIENDKDDRFPNGFCRSDYHRHGATDDDIEMWGLDQPDAPPPDVAGWVVLDIVEEMGW